MGQLGVRVAATFSPCPIPPLNAKPGRYGRAWRSSATRAKVLDTSRLRQWSKLISILGIAETMKAMKLIGA
jgi:hypothetical protein